MDLPGKFYRLEELQPRTQLLRTTELTLRRTILGG